MSLAIIENIAVVIHERLLAMIDDPVYSTEVVEVQRPSRFAAFTPRNNQVVITQGSTERLPAADRPGNPPAIAYRQLYAIHCHIMQDERSEDSIDSLLNAFHADIVKAIASPSSTWHTMNGNAIDCEWGSVNYVNADGGLDGLQIPLFVTLRVSENDPTEVRA